MPRVRDFIATGHPNSGAIVHEAAHIRQRRGLSVHATAVCGETFGESDDWVREFGSDDRVTCPHCRRITRDTLPATPGQ